MLFVLKATGWKDNGEMEAKIEEVLNKVVMGEFGKKCHINYLVENNSVWLLLVHY
jgi:hypothetical protein